jgi:formate--tetrahydrofolate ligase
MANLRRHLRNIRTVYGVPAVVAINRFPSDTDLEVKTLVDLVAEEGMIAVPATHFSEGGAGAVPLAEAVLAAIEADDAQGFSFVYPDEMPLADKAEAVASWVYGAAGVTWEAKAKRQLQRIEAAGYGRLPICMAKTQYSFSTDPAALGAPTGHHVNVREVRLNAGAGFVVLVTGDIMTMPGLPRVPASDHIDIDDDGNIIGLS